MNKTWFISGASSGLGFEMAEQLLGNGHRVIATTRRYNSLTGLQRKYGSKLDIVLLDLLEPQSITPAVRGAFRRHGKVDILVSNAEYALSSPAENLTDVQIEQQIATNLTGSVHLIRAALQPFRHQGGGRIVQVSSARGHGFRSGFSLYHATKRGIEAFVESVSEEVAPFAIDFIIAELGDLNTRINANPVRQEPRDAYQDTFSLNSAEYACPESSIDSDVIKTASAIISAAQSSRPPLRLTLASSTDQAMPARLPSLA
ncbi:SDR family NAD(P)-dependent oxidoreductase [Agrobacterium tumefaciens]|uniref:Short-chain dehydrogenase/reductase n=1 Tax=Agrobacterium tumefaciens TaxID=358 RepID=A0A176XFM1_AGRTU|nr:SDR family NAD(P)-dependent oxidoreductase [Agrobacterium tumefaciens]OAE48226.1 short-chain dehydrogenase/reductase [Agrobacterium tumefaciens]